MEMCTALEREYTFCVRRKSKVYSGPSVVHNSMLGSDAPNPKSVLTLARLGPWDGSWGRGLRCGLKDEEAAPGGVRHLWLGGLSVLKVPWVHLINRNPKLSTLHPPPCTAACGQGPPEGANRSSVSTLSGFDV